MVSTPSVWTPSEERVPTDAGIINVQTLVIIMIYSEHEIQQFGFNHLLLRPKTGTYNNQSTNM